MRGWGGVLQAVVPLGGGVRRAQGGGGDSLEHFRPACRASHSKVCARAGPLGSRERLEDLDTKESHSRDLSRCA